MLVRGGAGEAGVLGQVLEDYGIPVSLERRIPLGRTRLGAGVLAGARAALPGGTAADVLTWLRTPGRLADADGADALEAHVRRAELTTAAEARRALARIADADDALIDLATAAGEGAEAFLAALVAEAEAIWTAPHRRAAAVLGPEAAADARAAAALRKAADELRALAAAEPALAGSPQELLAALADVPVREPAAEGAVLVADPLAIRARRFRAVFVCGLPGGRLPAPPDARAVPRRRRARLARRAPAGSCSPATRTSSRASATCSTRPSHGPRRCCSCRSARPTRRAIRRSRRRSSTTSARSSPTSCGRAAAGGCWARSRGRRRPRRPRTSCGARGRSPRSCPSRRRSGRRGAEPVLGLLAARDTEAARGLENFAGCGVRWLIESVLRPERTDPDPEPMRRGSIAHAVLEQTLRRLGDREGSARLTPASLPAALEELDAAMAERRAAATGTRARAALRELEVDLRRLLRHEAETGPGLEPRRLEWSFGREGDEHGRCRSRAPGWASPAAWTGSTSTPAAGRWCATTRAAQ